ncbi:MAG: Na+/proline symporter [Chlorobi bacterium OLB6]|nr:MAG: Na+/proline symporter [Chlorobi bacterium OLB6]
MVILPVIAALSAGLYAARQRQSPYGQVVGYVLAGRSLTAPFFVASLVATWYGNVLGSGEFILRNGIAFMVCLGLPYYVMGILYGCFFASRIRTTEIISIPDVIRKRFGITASKWAAIAVLVIGSPAPYVLALGVFLHTITGIDVWICVVSGAVVSVVIVAKGGLRSDVAANVVQVVLMYAGFIALTVACIFHFGTDSLLSSVPAQLTEIPGPIGWSGIVVWFFIAMQTFVDPNFFMRAAAARTPGTARKGMFWSVACWVVFDILQLITGLYGIAHLPVHDGASHYLLTAEAVLPDVWKGLFLTSVLATIISTLDGYILVSATTVGYDLWPWKNHSEKFRLFTGLSVASVLSIVLAITVPSIINLIELLASIAVPGLLLPLILALRTGQRGRGVRRGYLPDWTLIVVPMVTALLTHLVNNLFLHVVEPMFAGILVSVFLAPFITREHVYN